MGGGDVPVRLLQGEMQVGVFHGELRLLLPTAIALKLGVEVGVETVFVVEEFLVAKQWRIGPDRLQEKRFAPAGMGTDQIGREAFPFELLSSTGTSLGTNDLGFCFHHQGMDTLGVAAIKAVTEMLEALGDATPAIQSIDAQGHQLVLPLLSQALNDVDVLPWKVLMNEENSH